MTVLGTVVQALVLSVLDPGHDRSCRRAVASQLVGNHHTWCPPLPLHQLAQQALGGSGVAAALDEDVEHDAILVDSAPEYGAGRWVVIRESYPATASSASPLS